jgi:hypothetical protein
MLFLSVGDGFVKNPVNPHQAYGGIAFDGRRVDLPESAMENGLEHPANDKTQNLIFGNVAAIFQP